MKNNHLAYNFVILCTHSIFYICYVVFVLFLLFRILFYCYSNTMMHHCEQWRAFFLMTFYIYKDEGCQERRSKVFKRHSPHFWNDSIQRISCLTLINSVSYIALRYIMFWIPWVETLSNTISKTIMSY